MRVTTFNVNGLRARLDTVLRFSREHRPDVLCLQETKLTNDLFPHDTLAELFPYRAVFGQKGYNGTAILSQRPLSDLQRGFAAISDPEARLIAVTVSGMRLYNLYVPNGAPVGSERFQYKLAWYESMRAELDRYPASTPLLVVGDMNVAPGDKDVWDPAQCEGTLLCHRDERAAFQHLLDWGLTDAFRERHPDDATFSWWDYQQKGFARDQGLRIDHTLLSAPLMARCQGVTIHRDVRGWPEPSDHTAVSVDLLESDETKPEHFA